MRLLIRTSIMLSSVYLLIVILYAWKGIDIYEYNYLLGHNFIGDTLMTVLCLSDKKYNCKYMIFLCYNLLFVDIIGFWNAKYAILSDSILFLRVLSASWCLAAIITISLAIQHYIKVRRLRHKTTIYEEYKIRNNEAK